MIVILKYKILGLKSEWFKAWSSYSLFFMLTELNYPHDSD